MKPRTAGLFAVPKVSKKQDRGDNATGQCGQQNSDARNKERKNDNSSHNLRSAPMGRSSIKGETSMPAQ
jgi:hypothetical protein